MSSDDLKKLNKNKKLIKKLARKYDAFIASDTLIKQIPRLLGPGLSKGMACSLLLHECLGGVYKRLILLSTTSRQISHPNFPQRRSGSQDYGSQVYHQVPVEESFMYGCCSGQCWDVRGRIDLEHHAGDQLFGLFVEEGMAECGQLDHQGQHVTTEAPVLDDHNDSA